MRKYKHILNAATISGLLAFGVFLLLYLAGLNPMGGWSWLTVILPVVFMYMGIKRFRTDEGEGFLSYGQGLLSGLVFGFIYASLSAMLILIYGTLIDAGFLEVVKNENLRELGKTKDQLIQLLGRDFYQERLDELEQMSVGQLAFSDFLSKLIGSALIALIMAGTLLKRPPRTSSEEA